ncbi:MAG: hypothetical protein K2Y18_08445 [Alphaproteobacteria bacterium]|jgi:hypothetical protein|nr:hypothetical protein [Alphaproteobacteria bacterium]
MRNGLILTILCSAMFCVGSTYSAEGNNVDRSPRSQNDYSFHWGEHAKIEGGGERDRTIYGDMQPLNIITTDHELKSFKDRLHKITANPKEPGAKEELERIEKDLKERPWLEAKLTKEIQEAKKKIFANKK